jgi:hypothetical protein
MECDKDVAGIHHWKLYRWDDYTNRISGFGLKCVDCGIERPNGDSTDGVMNWRITPEN